MFLIDPIHLSLNYFYIYSTATGDDSGKQKFESFDYRGKYKNLAEAHKFRVPTLKIGTIDSLITLSDEFTKLDSMLGTLAKKIKRVFDDTYKQEPGKMSSDMIHLLKQIGDENYHIEDDSSSVSHQLMIGEHDNAKTPREYIENFQWNKHMYNELESIEKFKEKIVSEFSTTDEELRRFSTEFTDVKSQVTAHERKLNGSLLIRPISKYIKPSEHIVETEHLTTVFIAVPRQKQQEFLDTYMTIEDAGKQRVAFEKARAAEAAAALSAEKAERAERAERAEKAEKAEKESPKDASKLAKDAETDAAQVVKSTEKPTKPKESLKLVTPTVVPNSALKVIGEAELPDDEFVLFRVVLFKRYDSGEEVDVTEKESERSAPNVEFYKALCRERRWTIRPFKYDKDEEKHNSIIMADLVNRRRAAWRYMLIWCESKFDSVFTAWIHCIATRVFVESILRYGVRASISALILKPLKGQDKKLRDVLDKIFSGDVRKKQIETGEIDLSSFGGPGQEDYPYVNVTVDFGDF